MRVAIVLAAGQSRRFRGGNKLLARRGESTVIALAVRAACAAPVARVIVATGHDAIRVRRAVHMPRIRFVHAKRHRRGMSESLGAALDRLWPIEREVFVFLGDMPSVPQAMLRAMARRLQPGIAAVRPRGPEGPGHPVLMRRPMAGVRARLSGDRGLAGMIAGPIRWMERKGWQPSDIDSRYDLARMRSRKE